MDAGNYIIFLIVIFIIFGLLFILNIFAKAYVWNSFLNKMKNNSGNFNTSKILMMVSVVIALYFFLTWMFGSKQTIRPSLTHASQE
jgi:hypothetical protein